MVVLYRREAEASVVERWDQVVQRVWYTGCERDRVVECPLPTQCQSQSLRGPGLLHRSHWRSIHRHLHLLN